MSVMCSCLRINSWVLYYASKLLYNHYECAAYHTDSWANDHWTQNKKKMKLFTLNGNRNDSLEILHFQSSVCSVQNPNWLFHPVLTLHVDFVLQHWFQKYWVLVDRVFIWHVLKYGTHALGFPVLNTWEVEGEKKNIVLFIPLDHVFYSMNPSALLR